MYLSNLAGLLSCLLAISLLFQACGSSSDDSNANSAIAEPSAELPFSTNEPEIFQADFVRSVGGLETRSFYVKKGDKWRFDSYVRNAPARSIISTDKRIYVDHASRSYAESPTGAFPAPVPDFVSDLTNSLLRQREHSKFETVGTEGDIVTYRVLIEGQTGENLIRYDKTLGMIVRQELRSADGSSEFIFELRNVKLEADESLFAVSQGFRKITWDEFKKLPPR